MNEQRNIFLVFLKTWSYIQVTRNLCTQLRNLHHPNNQVAKLYTNIMGNKKTSKSQDATWLPFFTPYNNMQWYIHLGACANGCQSWGVKMLKANDPHFLTNLTSLSPFFHQFFFKILKHKTKLALSTNIRAFSKKGFY